MSATTTNRRPLNNQGTSPVSKNKMGGLIKRFLKPGSTKNIYGTGARSLYKNTSTLQKLTDKLEKYKKIKLEQRKKTEIIRYETLIRDKIEEIKRWKEKKEAFNKIRNKTNITNEQKYENIKSKNVELTRFYEKPSGAKTVVATVASSIGINTLGGGIKDPQRVTEHLLALAPPEYKKALPELSRVIEELYKISGTTEANQVMAGKKIVDKIGILLNILYYIKVKAGPSSPFVQGIKNGWETYNAEKIRRPIANLISKKIQVRTNTIDTLLHNLYTSKNNRTQAHGTKLGKNIAQLLFNLQNKSIFRTQKNYFKKTTREEKVKKYINILRQKVYQKKNPTSNFIKSIIYGIKQPGLLNKLGENSKLRQVVNVTLTNKKQKELQNLLATISSHRKKNYTSSKEAENNGKLLGQQMATLLNNYGNILQIKSGTTNTPLSNNKKKIIRNYKIGVVHGFKPLIFKQMGKSTLTNIARFVTYKPVVNTARSIRNNPSKLMSSVAKLMGTGAAAAVCHNMIPVLHGKYFYSFIVAQAAQVAAQGATWSWPNLPNDIKCLINQLLSKFSGEIAIRFHDKSFSERPIRVLIALLNAYKRHNPDENHDDLNKGITKLNQLDKFFTPGGRKAGILMAAVNTVIKEPIKAMRRFVIPNAIRTNNNRQKYFNKSGLIKYKKYFNAVSGLSTNGNKINLKVALNAIGIPNKLIKNEQFNPDQENVKRLLTQDNRKLLLLLQKRVNQNRTTLFQAMAPTGVQKLFGYEPNKSTWKNRFGRLVKKENFKTVIPNLKKSSVAVVKTIPKTAITAVTTKIKVRSRGRKRRAGGR